MKMRRHRIAPGGDDVGERGFARTARINDANETRI